MIAIVPRTIGQSNAAESRARLEREGYLSKVNEAAQGRHDP